ncbi:MAG: ABC transporter ATP-binding protein [Bdellovibrionota bacterium]
MLELSAVSKSYVIKDRQIEVLKNVSLKIPRGEFVAVLGRSGSGKSTLLSLMSGLDVPSSGVIRFDGVEIQSMNEDELTLFRRDRMGFVFQSYHLIPSLNALENVLLPLELANKRKDFGRAKDLLEMVGLKDRMNHRPSELSGGEQQRLSICRAVVHRPAFIFADEPTGNLDTNNGQVVMNLLREMKENSTLIMVTHDRALANESHRQIEIRDGEIFE